MNDYPWKMDRLNEQDEFEDFDDIELGDNDDYDDFGEKSYDYLMEEFEDLFE